MNWISIKDKVPNCSEIVLCWGESSDGKWGKAVRKVIVFHGSTKLQWHDYCDARCDYALKYINVTHWMPLPKGPNGMD